LTSAQKICFAFLCVGLIFLAVMPAVSANSAKPPGLIVIVDNPPDDLTLSLRFGESESETAELSKVQTAWEAQYRFFYGESAVQKSELVHVSLIASSGGHTTAYPIPEGMLDRYNTIMTFDYNKGTIKSGQTFGRMFTLVSLRVVLTLLIEGLIFFLFGYRRKRSWIAFIGINLFTQGALNFALNQSFTGSYLLFALVLYEIVIIIAELIAFGLIVTEHRKRRTVGYVLLANIASLFLGGFLLTHLPV